MKKEIKAQHLDLKGAFKKHSNFASTGQDISHHLLLFYANECGLKALFIRENNLSGTGDLQGKIGIRYGYGHDLLRWIEELKIPASEIKFKDNPNDPLISIHEKLRYGLKGSNLQISFLKSLNSLIKKRL